ncbi:MAG TPA: hypothetical protein VNX22_05410 [Acidobacteriaceae bacterium]|nr:hypothetical protein [Acidobacteriaceae bacterium]
MRHVLACLLLAGAASASASTSTPKNCITPEDTMKNLGKNVCLRAHVYDVQETDTGTRYLDVCAPQVKDDECKFYIVSFQSDEKHVGNLEPLRNADIEIRGTVREYHGRAEIVLNDQQQLHNGKERFRPNPALSKFDASTGHVAFKDPSASLVVHANGAFSHRYGKSATSKASTSK